MEIIAHEVLYKMNGAAINSIIESLNKSGIVSDEDETGLHSVVIERWNEQCDAYLKERGYEGGPLRNCGKYVAGTGGVYAIYNPERVSYEEAIEYIESL